MGKKDIPLYMGAIVVAALILALAYFSYNLYSSASMTCRDDLCFISRANDCRSAVMDKIISQNSFRFSAKDCVLTKTFLIAPQGELDSVKLSLEGKFMSCPYEPGKFDPSLINSISLGINDCDGQLKDVLLSLTELD